MRASRIALAFVLLAATALVTKLVAHSPEMISPQDRIGVWIPMRDGVRLMADVFVPPGRGPWPAVLVRTPYGRKSAGIRSYRYFVRRQYAVVLEDVRGRFSSQGVFPSIQQEGPDGSDTIDWIAAQPWSNGRVAMAGSSYLGMAQWWAAIEDNPHLVTISPMCAGDDEYLDRSYSPGGALQLSHRLEWLRENFMRRSFAGHGLGAYLDHLPIVSADVAALGFALPRWRGILAHPSYDGFWRDRSLATRLNRVKIPVLSFGGWFDTYAEGDLDAFSRLAREGRTVETWIGPWWHNPALKFATRNFGLAAAPGLRLKQAAWFDRWLKPSPSRADPPRAVLHIFVMGPNIWRDEHEWPLARTRYMQLYLASNRELRWRPARRALPDSYIYDPAHPVPTTGGATCCDSRLVPPGPLDQTIVERRSDVLVYTSAPLTHDLEVTGPVRAILYVATSAEDTDFTAKLVDVFPDSRPLLVTDGIQRLRYRLSLERPEFVTPGMPYRIEIDAGVTSYVFPAGHRIRVEIASSNFPRFDRNLNSMRPNAFETRISIAKQTVFHDRHYRSAIVLPVIPE